jgi:hypothetical protein
MESLIDYVSGCYIMSDAVCAGQEGYNVILDRLADTNWRGTNSNSGNEIILWIFS